MNRIAKSVALVAVVLACTFGMAACSGSGSGSGSGAAGAGASGGAAATVNGTAIPEQEITDQIQEMRVQSDVTSESAWGEYLAQLGQTPEGMREQYIQSAVNNELMRQGAKDLGITVDKAQVDEIMQSMKNGYATDAEWKAWLDEAGYTEDSYRKMQEDSMLSSAVNEHFAKEAKASEADINAAAASLGASYDGAKRTSRIVFYMNGENNDAVRAKANDVLGRINSGGLSFGDAARMYSDDPEAATNNGDAGWDVVTGYTEAYGEAVKNLGVGQVSGVIDEESQLVLVRVDEVFNAPAEITSVSQLPEGLQTAAKESAESMAASEAYSKWLDGLRESGNIVVNPMPSGLPYAVDMSKYATSSASAAAPAETEGAASAAAEDGESAASESSSSSSGASSSGGESSSSPSSSSSSSSAAN